MGVPPRSNLPLGRRRRVGFGKAAERERGNPHLFGPPLPAPHPTQKQHTGKKSCEGEGERPSSSAGAQKCQLLWVWQGEGEGKKRMGKRWRADDLLKTPPLTASIHAEEDFAKVVPLPDFLLSPVFKTGSHYTMKKKARSVFFNWQHLLWIFFSSPLRLRSEFGNVEREKKGTVANVTPSSSSGGNGTCLQKPSKCPQKASSFPILNRTSFFRKWETHVEIIAPST